MTVDAGAKEVGVEVEAEAEAEAASPSRSPSFASSWLKTVFRSPAHVDAVLLFYDGRVRFANRTSLARVLRVCHVTARKVAADLLRAGVLKELEVGSSKVVLLNEDSPLTRTLFKFLDELRRVGGDAGANRVEV